MDFSSFLKKKESELRLQFYSTRPTKTLLLEKVEELAVERLKILRCVEAAGQEFNKHTRAYSEWLESQLRKGGALSRAMTLYSDDSNVGKAASTAKNDIEDDVYSQFIVSLAYCRTEALAKWYLAQEVDLFLFRLKLEANHDPGTMERFINQYNLKLVPASDSDKSFMEDNGIVSENSLVYKVHFTEVPDLVNMRNCFTSFGRIFLISISDISSIIKTRFRVQLSHILTVMRSHIDIIDQDTRLRPLLTTLNSRYIGKSYIVDKDTKKITAADIPALAKTSFPPCMDQINGVLSFDHHLKHDGRLQYSLFLKAIGLPIEESIKFFSESFQPKTDPESFSKKYAYNIRHNYGLEGKRIDYSPYSCSKIINTNVVNGCGGCPFKTTDKEELTQKLKNHPTATEEQINSIIDKVSKSQYQIGCREYFKMMHNLPSDYLISIIHPNEYFEESQKILQSKLDVQNKF